MLLSSTGDLPTEESYSFHISLVKAPVDQDPPTTGQESVGLRLFDSLPDNALRGRHGSLQKTQRQAHKHSSASKSSSAPLDYRFGPIQIDWADRMATSTAPLASQGYQSSPLASASDSSNAAKKRRKKKSVFRTQQPQVSIPVAKFEHTDSFEGDAVSDDRTQLTSVGERFDNMSIGATEVAFGIVHLFRDKQEAVSSSSQTEPPRSSNQIPDADVGAVVAVLAVPSHMTASDFLSFIEPAVEAVTQLRMIRDMRPNRCMVLIKFRDAQDAQDFHKMFNAQPFNAMDPQEICQVVYVTSVTVSSQSTIPRTYPMLSNTDPWPLQKGTETTISFGQELPTCPVCLERMDSSVTGLMTISCQHTFHCSCLSKWGESRCPVCRYSQSTQRAGRSSPSPHAEGAESSSDDSDPDEVELSACAVCETQQDLWVCLICASVGCGRYKQGHAHQHFNDSGHLYSLELETQRVWDYAGDGYVHRLIQNKADGKLVELPSASSAAATPERSRRLPPSDSQPATPQRNGPASRTAYDALGSAGSRSREDQLASGSSLVVNEKIEAIGLEYSYLLTSQLESQRHFYEDTIEKMTLAMSKMTTTIESMMADVNVARETVPHLERLKRDNDALLAERDSSKKRADKVLELARHFESELNAERSISNGLMTRLEATDAIIKQLQDEAADQREQLSDLMFFVQARDKLDQEGGEAQGGQLSIGPGPKKHGKTKK